MNQPSSDSGLLQLLQLLRLLVRLAAAPIRGVGGLTGDLVGRVLSPASCAACGVATRRSAVFCVPCAATVQRCELPSVISGDAAVAFGWFGGALATAVKRLKYEGRSELARPLGDLVLAAALEHGVRGDVVVPVPLHPRKLCDRGYNQAALLARALVPRVAPKLVTMGLRRVQTGQQQARLARRERLTAVRDVYRVVDPSGLRGRNIVLVDDVATTGATLATCRHELLASGARSVTCVVAARAE